MEAFVWKHGKAGEGFSQKEIGDSLLHPGRRTNSHGYQSAASWIDELGQRRQLIILCPFCRPKFNYKKLHYVKFYVNDITGRTDGTTVTGKCDDCKEMRADCTGFIYEEYYSEVCGKRPNRGTPLSRFLNLSRR